MIRKTLNVESRKRNEVLVKTNCMKSLRDAGTLKVPAFGPCVVINAYCPGQTYGCTRHIDFFAGKLDTEIEAINQEELDESVSTHLEHMLGKINSDGVDTKSKTLLFAVHSGTTTKIGQANVRESFEKAFAKTGENTTLLEVDALGESITTSLAVSSGLLTVKKGFEDKLLRKLDLSSV